MSLGSAQMSGQRMMSESDQNTRPFVSACHTRSFVGAQTGLWPSKSHQRSVAVSPNVSRAASSQSDIPSGLIGEPERPSPMHTSSHATITGSSIEQCAESLPRGPRHTNRQASG